MTPRSAAGDLSHWLVYCRQLDHWRSPWYSWRREEDEEMVCVEEMQGGVKETADCGGRGSQLVGKVA